MAYTSIFRETLQKLGFSLAINPERRISFPLHEYLLLSSKYNESILDNTVHGYFPFANPYNIRHHYICLCSCKRFGF